MTMRNGSSGTTQAVIAIAMSPPTTPQQHAKKGCDDADGRSNHRHPSKYGPHHSEGVIAARERWCVPAFGSVT